LYCNVMWKPDGSSFMTAAIALRVAWLGTSTKCFQAAAALGSTLHQATQAEKLSVASRYSLMGNEGEGQRYVRS
jgi:hypothetical protein